jgi:chitin disaccharide deacetylase
VTPIAFNSPFALIVTADDFGIGYETSRGIIQAHLNGPVTATSLMAITGDHVRASLPLLADAPNLDVGLHLALTNCGEKPLVAGRSSGLTDRQGFFLSNGRLWIRSLQHKLQRAAVAEEITAQAEMFYKLVGRIPDYVDCHHHAHQLPIIRDALTEVIAAGKLPSISRITRDPPGMAGQSRLKRRAANFMGKAATKTFSAANIWTNDFYFGMLTDADLNKPFPWDRYLKAMPRTGVIEWVVHPGFADPTLAGRDDYRAQRLKELQAITNPDEISHWEKLRPFLTRKSVLCKPKN